LAPLADKVKELGSRKVDRNEEPRDLDCGGGGGGEVEVGGGGGAAAGRDIGEACSAALIDAWAASDVFEVEGAGGGGGGSGG
jgi:hypothetical protein